MNDFDYLLSDYPAGPTHDALSTTDNVIHPPESVLPFLPTAWLNSLTGEVMDVKPTTGTVVHSEDGLPVWLPETEANGHVPLVDESLKASLLRQGRSGLTRREGRRVKHFTPAPFPVAYERETWEGWQKKFMKYLTGTAYRVMHQDGIAPSTKMTLAEMSGLRPRQEQVAETVSEIVFSYDLEHTHYFHWDGEETILSRGARLHRDREIESNDVHLFTQRVGYSAVEAMVVAATAYAWEHWDKDYLKKRSLMGRKGGELSKRPKVITFQMIEALGYEKPEDHKPEIAESLNCSVRTVERRLAEAYLSHVSMPIEENTMPAQNPTPREKTAAEVAAAEGVSVSTVKRRHSEPWEAREARVRAKEALALSYKEEGLKDRQIAVKMDMSVRAVSALIYRARKRS